MKTKGIGAAWTIVILVIIGFTVAGIAAMGGGEEGSRSSENTETPEGGSKKLSYSNTYDSATFVTTHYTDVISADNAMLCSEVLNGYLKQQGTEQMFDKTVVEAYIHEEANKTVLKIKTGFDSKQDITSLAETLHEEMMESLSQTFGSNFEVRLIDTGGDVLKSLVVENQGMSSGGSTSTNEEGGAVSFAGGSGTEEDPHKISNVNQLQAMEGYLNRHFVLTNDINASETKEWNPENKFVDEYLARAHEKDFQTHHAPIVEDSESIYVDGELQGKDKYVIDYGSGKIDFFTAPTDYNSAYSGKQVTIDYKTKEKHPRGFKPIGSYENPFLGSFNGKGHTISNLYINRGDKTGLFNWVGESGDIERVGIENVNIIRGEGAVGGLVGMNHGGVSDSYVTGSITGGFYVGGLVGKNNGEVSDSYSAAHVTGERMVGGLIGWNESKVSNSHSTGDVVGIVQVGGLFGLNHGSVSNSYSTSSVESKGSSAGFAAFNSGTIENCYSTGNVNGEAAAGLVESNQGDVSNSYSTSSVESDNKLAGGLVGYNVGLVSNSYSRGSVTGSENVGGLVAVNHSNGEILNCYSTGSVTGGDAQVGGLVGYNGNYKNVEDSFWDIETSGIESSDGGTGKTTGEMKTKSTFTDAGWDFENVWNIESGINDGYPFLRDLE